MCILQKYFSLPSKGLESNFGLFCTEIKFKNEWRICLKAINSNTLVENGSEVSDLLTAFHYYHFKKQLLSDNKPFLALISKLIPLFFTYTEFAIHFNLRKTQNKLRVITELSSIFENKYFGSLLKLPRELKIASKS